MTASDHATRNPYDPRLSHRLDRLILQLEAGPPAVQRRVPAYEKQVQQ